MARHILVAAFVVSLATVAQAGIIPGGGFEGGGPPGAAYFGNTSITGIVGTGPSVKAGDGLFFLQSSTGGSVASLPAGTGPAPFFVGDPTGSTLPITEYSGFSFPLSVLTPSVLSFLINFQSSESYLAAADFMAGYVDGGGGAVLGGGLVVDTGWGPYSPLFVPVQITDFDGAGITDPLFGTYADGQTGWFPASVPLAPGNYTIYMLVADVEDGIVDTGFSVDDITLTAIPEPGAWLLFGAGALGLFCLRRLRERRRRAA